MNKGREELGFSPRVWSGSNLSGRTLKSIMEDYVPLYRGTGEKDAHGEKDRR
jgi:hypothetical protein